VNGIIYVIGGDNAIAPSPSANVFKPVTTVEAYDPIGNTWTTKVPMPTARERFAIAAVNGVIYVFGGLVPDATFVKKTASVEAYDTATNTWSAKAPLRTARDSLSSAAVDGVIYVMGGRADAAPFDLAVVEAYDPVANAWTTKASMTVITGGLSSVALGRSIYAVVWNYGYTTVEAYDPTANAWTAKTALRVGFSPRDWFSATAAGNAIYALGGYDSFGPLATVEAITP
jgi:N-acetylneuraminic acid mutarotase